MTPEQQQAAIRQALGKPTFWARCQLAQECLPDAPYRAMLTKLHEEMLAALEQQPADHIEQPLKMVEQQPAEQTIQEWMKPHPKCDGACLYQCTQGFRQFPECADRPADEPVAWYSPELGDFTLIKPDAEAGITWIALGPIDRPQPAAPVVPPQWLAVLKEARSVAMRQASAARIPECGHFGEVAQDLDWLLGQMLAAAPEQKGNV